MPRYKKAPAFVGKDLRLNVGRGDVTILDGVTYDSRFAKFVPEFMVEVKEPLAAARSVPSPAPVAAPAVRTPDPDPEPESEQEPASDPAETAGGEGDSGADDTEPRAPKARARSSRKKLSRRKKS